MKNKRYTLVRLYLLLPLCLMQTVVFSQSLASIVSSQQSSNGTYQNGAGSRSLSEVLKETESKFSVFFTYKNKTLEGKTVEMPKLQLLDNTKSGKDFDVFLSELLSAQNLKFKKIDNIYFIYAEDEKIKEKSLERKSNKWINSNKEPEDLLNNEKYYISNLEQLRAIREAMAIVVSGKVTGDNSEPLPGVNVTVKNTTTGTVTDVNGSYSLSVPNESSTLVFSYIGYVTEEIVVGSRTSLDVQLLPDIKSLSEVVVVGYGTQQRRDLTGSIASVKAEEIKNLPLTSLDQAIQGRAAGVQVTQNSGAPGGAVSVRIRGVGTLSGNNEPLYVIDGFPVQNSNNSSDNGVGTGQASNALSSINPNDIESIEILKDASSAAIYGTRASNGVVLITTKRGKEGRTRVEFDTYYGVQNRWKTLDLLNASEFARLANEAYRNANEPTNPLWANENAPLAADGSGPYNTNWQDQVFQTAPIQNYNISVSGGNAKTQAAFVGNFFKQDGILISSSFKRFSFRSNIDHQVGNKLRFGTSISVSNTRQEGVQTDDFSTGILQLAYQLYPMEPARRPDGSPAFIPLQFPDGSNNGQFYPRQLRNPLLIASYGGENYIRRNRLLGTIYGEYEIIKGLKWRTNVGTDLIFGYRQNWTPFLPPDIAGVGQTLQNSVYERNSQELSWLVENTLTYSHTFAGKHNLSAVIGNSAQVNEIISSDINAGQFQNNDIRAISQSTASTRSVTGGATIRKLASYLGRLNYAFDDKYLATFTLRTDASSVFNPQNRWATFPGASLGWRISKENFMSSIPFVTDLKLRASWGRLGNQEIGLYQYLSSYQGGLDWEYTFGTGGQSAAPGVGPSNLGNSNIKWETTEQTDIGLDAGFLNGRLSLTADYFIRNTFDILLRVPVPANLGAPGNTVIRNLGEVQNKGFELALGWNETRGDFTYGISGNITTIRNQVKSLGSGQAFNSGFNVGGAELSSRVEQGQPIGYFYGFKTDGLFRSQAEIDAANERARQVSGNTDAVFQAGVLPGDRRFIDINNDGIIDQNDRTKIGSPIPGLSYGLNVNLGYKGFDFTLFLQGVSDVGIMNSTRRQLYDIRNFNGQGVQNVSRDMLNRWSPDNTETSVPRITYATTPNNIRGSDFYVENGSFLRARNMQLGYALPVNVTRRFGVERLRVYVAAQNLFTITNYTGFDPEIGDFNQNALQSRFDQGNYPQPRTFLGGLNLQF